MGEEVTPRCWALSERHGVYCAVEMNHPTGCAGPIGHHVFVKRWDLPHHDPDSAPRGRKTAALRILEVSHEADRLLIVNNIGSRDWPELLRAIAARLYASNAAANADIATLCGEIGQGARLDECFDPLSANDVFSREILNLLRTARDILRTFAS